MSSAFESTKFTRFTYILLNISDYEQKIIDEKKFILGQLMHPMILDC